jgi:hypothetical protein
MGWLDDRVKLIETVPDTFVSRVDAIRFELFNELVRIVAGLDSTNGNFDLSALARIDEVIEGLGFLFQSESDYLKAVRELIGGLDEGAALADAGLNFQRNAVFQQVLDSQKFTTVQLFARPAIENTLGTPLRNLITSLVTNQAPVDDAIIQLRELILGADIDGALTRYAKTWGLTSFANAERQYVASVAAELGLEKWQYSGGTVKDSRDFCIHRVGKTFTTEEVKSWAALDWQGKMRGTDENNIFQRLGGWNCSHILQPVL